MDGKTGNHYVLSKILYLRLTASLYFWSKDPDYKKSKPNLRPTNKICVYKTKKIVKYQRPLSISFYSYLELLKELHEDDIVERRLIFLIDR